MNKFISAICGLFCLGLGSCTIIEKDSAGDVVEIDINKKESQNESKEAS